MQEERSRRNPGRYYDESNMMGLSDLNGLYHHDPASKISLPRVNGEDHRSHSPSHNASLDHHSHHAMAMNSYLQHPDMLATVNGSTAPHLAYYPANPVRSPFVHPCSVFTVTRLPRRIRWPTV